MITIKTSKRAFDKNMNVCTNVSVFVCKHLCDSVFSSHGGLRSTCHSDHCIKVYNLIT